MAKKFRFSKKEIKAFNDGLQLRTTRRKALNSGKELKSFERGEKIGKTKDFLLAESYTEHMNRKFGYFTPIFDKNGKKIDCKQAVDKFGRALGLDGKRLPTAYENYKQMQKNKELKDFIYAEYDWKSK